MMHKIFIFFFIAAGFLGSQTFINNPEYKKYYDQNGVTGSFFLMDLQKNSIISYNSAQYDSGFIPASTFKICNSLIALETGVAPDENLIIPWDSVQRQIPAWNHDQDMKEAIKNSTVWYYQKIARRIGSERMASWLKKLQYGNQDISGGIDKFWLTGGLRITPHQQIEFLIRLYKNELPLSNRSMEIVKKIMINEKTDLYTLYAKAGWGMKDSTDIGWWVGFIVKGNDVYFFANCVQNSNSENSHYPACRKDIAFKIFRQLHITGD